MQIFKLCESGKFDNAMELINQKLEDGASDSEVYCIKGQLEFDKIEQAINSLIESLRLDDKNQ